jgi:two-component system, NarL family, response regulator DesR
MIRVLLAEDQAMVRGALAALLAYEPDLSIIGTAADGAEALRMALAEHPDVLVSDVEMPQMDGIALAQAVKDAGLRTRILMLSTFGRAGYLSRAMKAGAAGYVLKDAPAEALADAIRTVHAGGRAISAELAVQSWQSDDPLNDRERQILKLAGAGLTSSAIGKRLNLSDGTIRNYLSEAISKMGAANRIEAALIAAERGWL